MSGMAGPMEVRVFPGQAAQASEARRWVRVLACAAGVLAADDAELVLAELFANASSTPAPAIRAARSPSPSPPTASSTCTTSAPPASPAAPA
jgi:hypothetical protein